MSNNIVLWENSKAILIPNNEQGSIEAISNYIVALNQKNISKIVNSFNSGFYDIAIEYAWNRAINLLEKKILSFGLDFIAEMVGRDYLNSMDEISPIEKINLAFELGIINSTAKLELTHSYEIIRHYIDINVNDENSNEEVEEINILKALNIILDLTKYILGKKLEDTSLDFIKFRENLKTVVFKSDSQEIETLKTSPYFYIKTIVRTLLNLIKTLEGGEREIALNNTQIFLIALWDKLFIEDKKLIGKTYAMAISEGNKTIFNTLINVLENTKGFDFVPETTRSNSYARVAKQLISAHFNFNNFYEEFPYTKKLSQMGSIIPDMAFEDTITAIILSYLGNQYGHSRSAKTYLKEILPKITQKQWEYFFNTLIIENEYVLSKLSNKYVLDNWFDLVENYVSKDLDITSKYGKKFYEASITKNEKVLIAEAKTALVNINGK